MGRRRKAKKFGFQAGGIFYKIAKTVAAPVAFVEQISEKHRQTLGTAFTAAPLTQKAKIMANIITGSATGFNFFKDEFQAPLSKFEISNIVNKWTKTGVAMIGYQYLASEINKSTKRTILPQGSKVGNIGRKILVGGAVGGILDDPVTSNNNSTGTVSLSPQTLQSSMIMSSGHSGSDSTESGL